jgi:DNA topoisomerase-2
MASKYQHLTDIEHVLLKPEMYIGNIENITKNLPVLDLESLTIKFKLATYNTGLLKMFDEVLVNAVDNYIKNNVEEDVDLRPPSLACGKEYKIEINIDSDLTITVKNSAPSIPISKFSSEYYIPEVIFSQLRSGSNFVGIDQEINQADIESGSSHVGGTFGLGVKLTNIFSTKFRIEIVNEGKKYTQTMLNNNSLIQKPLIEDNLSEHDYVLVSFIPDLKKLGVEKYDKSIIEVLLKRVHDYSCLPIRFVINGRILNKNTWKSFVYDYASEMHLSSITCGELADSGKTTINYAFGLLKDDKFKVFNENQVSFVNGVATYDGGSHVNLVINKIEEVLRKNNDQQIVQLVISRLFVFASILMKNPKFNSQTKTKLCSRLIRSNFSSIDEAGVLDLLNDPIFKNLTSAKIIEVSNKKLRKVKPSSVKKADNANLAGVKGESHKCVLFLCEGDSAQTLCIRGKECLGKLGSDYFGSFPLRGKALNVRACSVQKYIENEEWNNVKILMGLQDNKTYDERTYKNELNYGKIVIMKDADSDGASIMGLIINFFSFMFPSLLGIPSFFNMFLTPIIQVVSSKMINSLDSSIYRRSMSKEFVLPFYNEQTFKLVYQTLSTKDIKVNFIKGLGGNTNDDIKYYFSNYEKFVVNLKFNGLESENIIDKAFNPSRSDERKLWISTLKTINIQDQAETNESISDVTPVTFPKGGGSATLSMTRFFNSDFIEYGFEACERCIPNIADGLKPTQRKILFSLLNTSSDKEFKVIELGGTVTRKTLYHHGDQSLYETIIGMAQDFTGSNNLNLLRPIGQFGSRLKNGDDSAAPRYLSTSIMEWTLCMFPSIDNTLLTHRTVDGRQVEPIRYVPILPLVLCNGAEGIGTGWSTSIIQFNPFDLIKLLEELLSSQSLGLERFDILPWYRGFKGNISLINSEHYLIRGIYTLNNEKLTIRELPVTKAAKCLFDIKESLKLDKNVVKWYDECLSSGGEHELTIIYSTPSQARQAIKDYKLEISFSNKNMVLFDKTGSIKKYEGFKDIFNEWFELRYRLYLKRLKYIQQTIIKIIRSLSDKSLFISLIVEEKIEIRRIRKKILFDEMLKYDFIDKSEENFNTLIDLPLKLLTFEHFQKIRSDILSLEKELEEIKKTKVEDLWIKDIQKLKILLSSQL